jgi:hypothetical protein
MGCPPTNIPGRGDILKDYYQVLGVSPGAPATVIKAAYRALMKIHHPDVGGDPQRAKEIEEAYRMLSQESPLRGTGSRPQTKAPAHYDAPGAVVPRTIRGKHLEMQILELQSNQVFTCPRECSYHRRRCRYKQQLSLESKDLFAFRATTLLLRLRNPSPYAQQVDCRNGRAVLIDQMGDFYACQNVCTWQHPPKYKEAAVEMFPDTQATMMLWFPQLPPGRYAKRFVYKHKVLVRDLQGDWLDEELIELAVN